MKDRLYQLRKETLNLSRAKFGEPVGMSDSEIKNVEYGLTELNDFKIGLICKEYHVNESWLRTGEGEMFVPKTRKQQVEDYMGALLNGERTELEEALIETMAETSIEEWRTICELFKRLADKMKKPDA